MVERGEETRSWADFVYQEMHVTNQTAWNYRRLWRLILDFPGLMFSLECMKSLLGWHNAVRAYMNGNPSISVIFQTPIAWMEIPQPYPSWNMKGSHSASSKPSFKTYHTHVLGSWQARFEAMRLARRHDAALQVLAEVEEDTAAFNNDAFQAHYHEYVVQGLATENACHFAADNKIDMSSIECDPTHAITIGDVQEAFMKGTCRPLVLAGEEDPDFVPDEDL